MPLRAQVQQNNAVLVAGTGSRITRQPTGAANVTLTASGTKYIFKAANANTIAMVAAAVIPLPFRILAVLPDTPSAVATWYNFKVGGITVSGAAINHPNEIGFFAITVAAGQLFPLRLDFPPTIPIDGVNDGIGGDLASSNAAADTCLAAVYIQQGMGS